MVVGDGPQEEEAAAQRMWPFVRVALRDSLPASLSDSCVRHGNSYQYKTPDATGSTGRMLTSIRADEILALLNRDENAMTR